MSGLESEIVAILNVIKLTRRQLEMLQQRVLDLLRILRQCEEAHKVAKGDDQ